LLSAQEEGQQGCRMDGFKSLQQDTHLVDFFQSTVLAGLLLGDRDSQEGSSTGVRLWGSAA